MIEEEEAFKDICVSLILDFCRDILEDQMEIDDITISKVNEFCQEWIDENFGIDQTIIDDPEDDIKICEPISEEVRKYYEKIMNPKVPEYSESELDLEQDK